jgi:hypothetical protein
MPRLQFDRIWASHPTIARGEAQPCRKKDGSVPPEYENQCAMAFGESWIAAGGSLDGYRGHFCGLGHGHKHPRGAEDLANFLQRNSTRFSFKKAEIFKAATPKTFSDRRGLIFFRNFWGPNFQGDHIDLWNGATLAKSGIYGLTYFQRAQSVWFWQEDKSGGSR